MQEFPSPHRPPRSPEQPPTPFFRSLRKMAWESILQSNKEALESLGYQTLALSHLQEKSGLISPFHPISQVNSRTATQLMDDWLDFTARDSQPTRFSPRTAFKGARSRTFPSSTRGYQSSEWGSPRRYWQNREI